MAKINPDAFMPREDFETEGTNNPSEFGGSELHCLASRSNKTSLEWGRCVGNNRKKEK